MASATPQNIWWRRLVAESSAKPCWICYKPTSTCLTRPDNSDWFFICPGHLQDPKFATAKDAEDLAKKQRDEEIEKEIEAVKKEFAEKMRKKMDRRRQKEFEKDGKKDPEKSKKKDEDEEKALEKEQEEKLKELEKKKDPVKPAVEGPRIFELQKSFLQMRFQQKAQAAAAKRRREQLGNPNLFPTVPKDL